MQVEGKDAVAQLLKKVKVNGPTVFWHGALASATATFVGMLMIDPPCPCDQCISLMRVCIVFPYDRPLPLVLHLQLPERKAAQVR